jgi:hypothetical protein
MRGSWILVLAILLVCGATAEACSASSVIRKAEDHAGTDHYNAIEEVVIETMTTTEGWEHEEATTAAIGSIIYDIAKWWYWDNGNGDVDWTRWDSAIEVDSSLDREYCWKYQTDHWDLLGAGPGCDSIRDHALMHGTDWENGFDTINEQPIAEWYEENDGGDDEPLPTSDHAG